MKTFETYEEACKDAVKHLEKAFERIVVEDIAKLKR